MFPRNLLGLCFVLISIISLTSCGGGGGGGGGVSAAPPSISVSISSSDNSISVGDEITITWSSSNASSCTASGAWSGSKAISGNETFIINSSGSKTFSLSCSGTSTSGSSSVRVDVGYPIAIGNLFHTNKSGIELFVDANQDFIKNTDEVSITTASDGSYELRNESETISECLKKYPLVSNDGLMLGLSTDYSSDKNINPFTSILGDILGNGFMNFIGYEDSQNECGPLNSYMRENSYTHFINTIIPRIETFDGYSFSDISKETVIDAQRNEDIIKFQNSAKSIADSMKSELDDAITGLGYSNTSVQSHAELDTSNYRIFLNTTSYPNPSTDTSTSATSVDTIAAKAGVRIRTTLPSSDYMPGWDLDVFYDTWDLKISNNGDILSDIDGCYINFSNLCKQMPSLLNGITYGSFALTEIYHKETTRGQEKFIKQERIYEGNSGACREWDYQVISSEKSDRFLSQSFIEYRGESYFSDLDCLTYDESGRGYSHVEAFPDGTKYFIEVWSDYGDYFPVNNEMILDNYDDNTPLPSQIPQEVVDVLINFGSVYDNSSSLDALDSSSNPFNIVLTMIYGDLAGNTDYKLLPTLTYGVSFFLRTDYINDTYGTFSLDFNTLSFNCRNSDTTINSSLYNSDWADQFQLCINMLNRKYVPEPYTLRNNSPYRGIINE